MAPLAATIAAGMAMRVGFALARASSERRSAKLRRSERRLGLADGESAREGLRRMLLSQIDLAIESLASAGSGERGEQAVHETRKAIKRMRTLLRLLKDELEEHVFTRENALLRELGHDLAGARDAEVMLETFEAVAARGSKQLRGRPAVARLRSALRAERERTRAELLGDEVGRRRAIGQLEAFRSRVGIWSMGGAPERGVEHGALRLYEHGRRRYRRAKRGKRPHIRRMHEWRKRVKDLRYVAEALGPVEPHSAGGNARAKKAAKWLHAMGKRADRLSEILGEEHDLAVLGAWIEERSSSSVNRKEKVGKRTAKELSRLIAKRRGKLRRRALREGERLYGQAGGKLTRRIRAARPSRLS